ncbi:MAG: hypothetical protein CR994_07230 [Maribacter sp.]|nr:MAG: hypothetical protein CR994_07230 [Maribacter sp.]
MVDKKIRIGFLYFEEIHHIPHFIGIASELSKNGKYEVDVLTYNSDHIYLYRLIKLLNAKNIHVKTLEQPLYRKAIDRITGRKKPSSVYLYRKHKNLFLTYDALVFTEKNHAFIHKKRGRKKKPFLIIANHGAPGRGYSFQPAVKLFDLALLCGNFYVDRLKKENLLIENHAVIGYSKFDVISKDKQDTRLFPDNKPIVLYNPHFNKINSSWYTHGLKVLEYFHNSKDYNLVFAPHIYLFNRKGFLKPSIIDKKYFNVQNIHIDLGSIKSSNMSYTLNSDIYLGDVSSQIFEFGIKPRPSVFINALRIPKDKWKNDLNHRFWKTGEVIEDINEFETALHKFEEKKDQYLSTQKQIFTDNFYIDEHNSASKKGALAIDDFMTKKNALKPNKL